tara:strand:- start:627 stop:1088 length:462 start_codon:yes stop_codon:yes gene_type:complete
MTKLKIIHHWRGAPGMRLLGLGPRFLPNQSLIKLQILLNNHTEWAKMRSTKDLKKALAGSDVIISMWNHRELVGFGRATSDRVYRAVLWDVVIASNQQRLGLGRKLIESLLASNYLKNVEKVYLMTSNQETFYKQVGFQISKNKKLMHHNRSK